MMTQRISIRTASSSDPVIADAMSMLDAVDTVSTVHPDMINFMGYLVRKNYVTAAQAAVIMGA